MMTMDPNVTTLFHCIEGRYDGDPQLANRILDAFCTCITAWCGNTESLRILMARSRGAVLGEGSGYDRAIREAMQANMVGTMAHLGLPDNHAVTQALRAAGMDLRSAEDVAKVEMILSIRRDLADRATGVWVSSIVPREEWERAGQHVRIAEIFRRALSTTDTVREYFSRALADVDRDLFTLLTGVSVGCAGGPMLPFSESDLIAAGFPTVAERQEWQFTHGPPPA